MAVELPSLQPQDSTNVSITLPPEAPSMHTPSQPPTGAARTCSAGTLDAS